MCIVVNFPKSLNLFDFKLLWKNYSILNDRMSIAKNLGNPPTQIPLIQRIYISTMFLQHTPQLVLEEVVHMCTIKHEKTWAQ
jgi:hypothetical protein